MKILAIDTATEQCSVALVVDDRMFVREIVTPRGHAELVLPMVDEVLRESGTQLRDLDALAFGRGPGAFTGVRIAVGVVQGLAFGANKPVVGISNLAAVAMQAPPDCSSILVCMDARMGEVYWGTYRRSALGGVEPTRPERVSKPELVDAPVRELQAAVGTGFNAYAILAERYVRIGPTTALPHARAIAALAHIEVAAGRTVSASEAIPIYLRDQVVAVP